MPEHQQSIPEVEADKLSGELANAEHRLLLLDYDGTLSAHIPAERRLEAFPYPGVVRALRSIIANEAKTRAVIVSARPIVEVEMLLGDVSQELEIWGIYGWERKDRRGEHHQREPNNPRAELALREAVTWAESLALEYETKGSALTPIAVALHWNITGKDARGRSAEELEDIILEYTDIAEAEGILQVEGGSRVRELLIPGMDKGEVVEELLAQTREKYGDNFMAVFFGDSEGDEKAFAKVRAEDAGKGILVNNNKNASRRAKTAAHVWIENPEEELGNILELWA